MEKSKWLMPAPMKKIEPASVKTMDLSSAKAKKQKMDNAMCGKSSPTIQQPKPPCPTVAHGSMEYHEFFKTLNKNFPKSACLMSKRLYYSSFIPMSATEVLPKPIMSYGSEESLKLDHNQLMNECQKLTLKITAKQVAVLEAETRRQSNSKLWFTHRAGRITASRLKSVVRTNPEKPSKSLIKSICYPEAYRFSSEATRYGCNHEGIARKKYESVMCQQHETFSVCESGLRVNLKWSFMGATPDGVVMCDCCGIGACEIKCPFCKKEKENLVDCAGDKGFCLVKSETGIQLDKNHAYYFQIQAQIHIMEIDYCDFIVWNENDIYIERVLPDIYNS
ncbi:uncharacterized protein LOC114538527 [Dendronephthya gigantea]|uniref:uncharacterized protein LOC114538527 n=1 Tax=Dendronephthya gigantea TaxID=151771 RepID=UPI0010696F24|nr:uncharacterized protein LOC114538527 [Dendronephthya gigantea]